MHLFFFSSLLFLLFLTSPNNISFSLIWHLKITKTPTAVVRYYYNQLFRPEWFSIPSLLRQGERALCFVFFHVTCLQRLPESWCCLYDNQSIIGLTVLIRVSSTNIYHISSLIALRTTAVFLMYYTQAAQAVLPLFIWRLPCFHRDPLCRYCDSIATFILLFPSQKAALTEIGSSVCAAQTSSLFFSTTWNKFRALLES